MNNIQKKNKVALKLGIIALIAVLAIGAVLVSWINRATTVANAANVNPRATFEDIRTGTLGNPGYREFATFDFQRKSGNFTCRFSGSNVYSGVEIANLIDYGPGNNRHSRLGTQSYAIRQRQHISSIPLLTLITHGQGGAGQRFY